jgi:hypothetical protein
MEWSFKEFYCVQKWEARPNQGAWDVKCKIDVLLCFDRHAEYIYNKLALVFQATYLIELEWTETELHCTRLIPLTSSSCNHTAQLQSRPTTKHTHNQAVPLKFWVKLPQAPPNPKHLQTCCHDVHLRLLDWMNSSNNGTKLDHLPTTLPILYI